MLALSSQKAQAEQQGQKLNLYNLICYVGYVRKHAQRSCDMIGREALRAVGRCGAECDLLALNTTLDERAARKKVKGWQLVTIR